MNSDEEKLWKRIDELENSLSDTYYEYRNEIDELKSELKELRKLSAGMSYSSQTQSVSLSIQEQQSDSFYKSPDVTYEKPAEISKPNESINEIPPTRTPLDIIDTAPVNKQSTPETQTDVWSAQPSKPAVRQSERVKFNEQPKEPGLIEVILSNFFQSIFSYLLSTLTIFSAPFHELYHRLIKLYYHYQKQGKAPVFLMTVAGLITLTVGFGYLLQYSFNTLFSDTLKALTGFVIGCGIIGAGILLSKKKTDFKDYGASVVALGVIFNYLTAYFVGPYYGLVGETSGLLLLLGVTLASFTLAIVFETRVVSAITLVGGVLMPFIFGDAESAGFVFLSYLFVLSVGNLYLSSRIKWPTLAQVSFILSLSVIEYIGISDAVSPLAAIGLLSGFFYVYTYYWSFDGFQLKEKLSKQDLTILVANIFYFIYVMLNISADSYLIAGALITHAILLSVTVKTLHLMKSIVAPVYMLMIGLLIATAVFVLSPADVTSIVWAIEGLAMLYIGFKFSHKLIRAEGYAIYIIAMSGLLWQAIEAFSSISSATLPWHWINLVAFGALSFVAYQLIYRYKDIASSFEIKAAAIQNEIFTFWGATALCIILVVYFLDAIAVLAVIPMIWCFYRVSRHQLKFAQLTGYLFFIAFIVQIAMGMVDIQSTVITEQSIYSWIAMLEVLIFTWAMRKYYQHYELEGLGRDIANAIHTAFFYAPAALILLGLYNIYTNHIVGSAELELSYLWLDFTLVGALLFIVYKLIPASVDSNKSDIDTHYAYILSESISLFISVFFLYTVSIVFGEWMYNAAVIPMFYLLYRGLKSNLKLTEKLAWLHFSLFGAMTYLSYQTVGNFHFSEQSIPTMIGWVEILLSAWAMQSIYDHLEFKKGGYEYSRVVRIGVYLLIPLLFLPRIMRLYADYLPVALWLSFVISWLMYKKLKIEALLKELSILFVVAIFSTVFMSSAAIVGFNELFGLVALITGVLVVSVFHYVEKTLSCRRVEDSPYHYLILISPYFYGFVLTGLSYAATHQLSISLVITGLYFLYLTQERKLFNVMKQTLNISYALSWIALISVPVLVFIQLIPENPYLADILVVILVNLIALAGLWYLTHHKVSSLEFLKRKYSNQNIQHWLCHILAFVVYTGSLNLLFMPWSMGISIAMLIHAVLILFLTLSVRYKELIKLSIILYSLTAIKLLFHDMGDSGNLFKVIALMCIGSILMVAAFFFQKLKNKQLA